MFRNERVCITVPKVKSSCFPVWGFLLSFFFFFCQLFHLNFYCNSYFFCVNKWGEKYAKQPIQRIMIKRSKHTKIVISDSSFTARKSISNISDLTYPVKKHSHKCSRCHKKQQQQSLLVTIKNDINCCVDFYSF